MVVKGVHATWGVVATKMSEGLPLESLTLLQIRPSQEDSNLKLLSQFVQSKFSIQNCSCRYNWSPIDFNPKLWLHLSLVDFVLPFGCWNAAPLRQRRPYLGALRVLWVVVYAARRTKRF